MIPTGRICNPCCCCKNGRCNLRLNCLVIGIIYILWAIEHLGFGIGKLPITCEAAMSEPVPQYAGLGRGGGGRHDHDRESPGGNLLPACETNSTMITLLIVLVVLTFLLWLAAGALLLLAVFKRIELAALAAGILMLIGLLTYFLHMLMLFLAIEYFGEFMTAYHWKHFYLIPSTTGLIMIYVLHYGQIAGYTIGTLICLGLGIWSTICCIQFARQIKAGVDLDPAEGRPPTVMASQQSVAVPSGIGSTAPPSFSRNTSSAAVEKPSQ